MSEQPGSQTVETQVEAPVDEQKAAVADALSLFGVTPKGEPKAEPPASEIAPEDAPAIEQPEPKKLKVKFNKEEVEVDEDKIPEYVQKGLALEKERERRGEYEKALDRAAKLQGFKDHAELMENLDRIEQERENKQKDEFDQIKQKIIDDLVYNGVDEQMARQYAENNPLVQQAREALQEKDLIREEQEKSKRDQQRATQWNELYQQYPDLTKEVKEDGSADWYTSDMHALVEQGYKPLHAYQLVNLDKLQTQTKKQVEQKLVKEQRLGLRAQVETDVPAEKEPEVSPALSSAFSLFGIDPRKAQKYAKK